MEATNRHAVAGVVRPAGLHQLVSAVEQRTEALADDICTVVEVYKFGVSEDDVNTKSNYIRQLHFLLVVSENRREELLVHTMGLCPSGVEMIMTMTPGFSSSAAVSLIKTASLITKAGGAPAKNVLTCFSMMLSGGGVDM